MFKETDVDGQFTDRTEVKGDYIVLEGKNQITIPGHAPILDVPSIWIVKVNPEKPIEVITSSPTYSLMMPVGEKAGERSHAEIESDESVFNAVRFRLIPGEEFYNGRDVFPVNVSGRSESGKAFEKVSLVYDPRSSVPGRHDILKYGFVPPSQTLKHLFYWLAGTHEFFNAGESFDIKISSDEADRLLKNDGGLSGILEARFKKKLTF